MIPSTTSIDELDPVTLATSASTPLTFAVGEGNLALSFALANDGNLLLPTRPPGSGFTRPLIFATNSPRIPLSADYRIRQVLRRERRRIESIPAQRQPDVQRFERNVQYLGGRGDLGLNRPPSADRTGARIQSGRESSMPA